MTQTVIFSTIIEIPSLQGKDEQVRQMQNLLTERAESVIEKDAKIKELEDKIQKQNQQMEEELEKERKENLAIKKELYIKSLPWWKKALYSRERLHAEIEKGIKG